jgi:hypothetical protein
MEPATDTESRDANTFYGTPVTDDHLEIIAENLGDKAADIGLKLGFKYTEIKQFEHTEPQSFSRRLLAVLNEWKRKKQEPVVGELIYACTQAKVGGEARRVLNYKDETLR